MHRKTGSGVFAPGSNYSYESDMYGKILTIGANQVHQENMHRDEINERYSATIN